MRVVPLTQDIEGSFLRFLRLDVIGNFFALLDLELYREETKFRVALEGAEILGYMLEHDEKDLNLRGNVKCAAELLKKASLAEPLINIEPRHIAVLKNFYEPTRRLGPPTGEKISTLLVMGMDREHFKPVIGQNPEELGVEKLEAAGNLYRKFYEEGGMGPVTRKDIRKAFREHLVYGSYEGGELGSFASGVTIEDLSYVAHVYTLPKFRGGGHATSVCSALVKALLSRRKEVIIMVLADNDVAQRVYEKIGFSRTGHEFLAFKGRKISD